MSVSFEGVVLAVSSFARRQDPGIVLSDKNRRHLESAASFHANRLLINADFQAKRNQAPSEHSRKPARTELPEELIVLQLDRVAQPIDLSIYRDNPG